MHGDVPEADSQRWEPRLRLTSPAGGEWLSLVKSGNDYVLKFHGLADFFIRDAAAEILCQPKAETPEETVRHLLLDQVLPLVVNLRGGEALHASAVSTASGAVAFAGSTRSGKSTLAGSFVRAKQPLLSDDCLALLERNRQICAAPAYPALRLWDDARAWLFGKTAGNGFVARYTSKQRVEIQEATEKYCLEPQVLRAVYILSDPEESGRIERTSIEQLTPHEGLMALVRCAIRFDIGDRTMLTRQLHFFTRVASSTRVRRLHFPRKFHVLDTVRDAILADLDGQL